MLFLNQSLMSKATIWKRCTQALVSIRTVRNSAAKATRKLKTNTQVKIPKEEMKNVTAADLASSLDAHSTITNLNPATMRNLHDKTFNFKNSKDNNAQSRSSSSSSSLSNTKNK